MAEASHMKREVLHLAYKIADSCARADIECECLQVRSDARGHWFDTAAIPDGADTDDAGREFLADALRYLDLRGLLIRDKDVPCIVTFRASE